METAATEVIDNRRKVREVAWCFDICHVILYCKKLVALHESGVTRFSTRVLAAQNEVKLFSYILKASNMYYGRATNEVRNSAFRCAVSQFHICLVHGKLLSSQELPASVDF